MGSRLSRSDYRIISPHKLVPKALVQLPDRWQVQVVVVVVGYEHKINVGQVRVIQIEGRLNHPPACNGT